MSAVALRTPGAPLKARQFLFLAEDLALRRVPAELRPPHRNVMWTILQLHHGDPRLHFEIQPQPARGLIEVGLHFESAPERNEALALALAHRLDLIAGLGPNWELEEWTASWRRLHYAIPTGGLTRDLAETAATELASLITATSAWLRDITMTAPL